MKVKRAYYIDDGVAISGLLIERLFRRPVFYSADARCGWQAQVFYKEHKDKVIVWDGIPQGSFDPNDVSNMFVGVESVPDFTGWDTDSIRTKVHKEG